MANTPSDPVSMAAALFIVCVVCFTLFKIVEVIAT